MPKINLNASETAAALREVQAAAHHVFTRPELLEEAFTHPSYLAEHPEAGRDNQRLEFLGDAVLQIILSDHLFQALPDQQEGVLTRLRSLLANEQANEGYTRALGLHRLLRLGRGEALGGGRDNPSILGDLFEAFLGALYLDGGIAPARDLVLGLLPDLGDCLGKLRFDENPKGALQKLCQTAFRQNVSYEVLSQTGPVHAPAYEVQVRLGERILAKGSGHSHKEAERTAAAQALRILSTELGETTPPPATATKADQPKPKPKPKPMTTKRLILALDFDGVICDSASETAASAYRAARTLWPDQFTDADIPAPLVQAFRQARPFLETGFQAIPMLKCLADGLPPEGFADGLQDRIQPVMDAAGLDRAALVSLFGQTRDQWMKEDLKGWLASHGTYPGTIDALREALRRHAVYILTTKQERFVEAILAENGVEFPAGAIYGLDRKLSKDTVLATLCGTRNTNVHFVEDRLETLERVRQNDALARVKLHYADWGYGLPGDLERLRGDRRIAHLTLDGFRQLLCQP